MAGACTGIRLHLECDLHSHLLTVVVSYVELEDCVVEVYAFTDEVGDDVELDGLETVDVDAVAAEFVGNFTVSGLVPYVVR